MPYRFITCRDKDPPWMNSEIKSAFRKKTRYYKNFIRRGRCEDDRIALEDVTRHFSELISSSQNSYFSKLAGKLNDPLLAPKAYWSILNRFLGKKKIPLIPPLFLNGNFVSDFKEKADLFNSFFSKQCTILDNDSTLPAFLPVTNTRLTTFEVHQDNIKEILKSLQTNKAHGWDNISIRMIKLCGDGLATPLCIIFNNCLRSSYYPPVWKKSNVVPVHKKDSKTLMNNYRPISLLPIFSKVFEKIIFNVLYQHLNNKGLLSSEQSGFRPGDSCVAQLISITHEIYQAFDCNPSLEVRGVFLDISKAFEIVWHKGLLFKLEQHGICGNLHSLLRIFLHNREQRVPSLRIGPMFLPVYRKVLY